MTGHNPPLKPDPSSRADAASGMPARKSLVALLTLLIRAGSGGLPVRPEARGLSRLGGTDGANLVVADAILAALCARGLVVRKGDRLIALDAGRAALRRLLADPESAFQDQHRSLSRRCADPDGSEAGLGAQVLRVNDLESPLAALARIRDRHGAPWLSADLVIAGDRLRSDFTRGQLAPGISSRWSELVDRGRGGAGGIADLTDAALSARRRFEAAFAAVGPELSGLLVDVCCFLKGIEQVERERQWPQRSAKLMLRTGLSILARHYQPPARTNAGRLRSWGGEGYRPDLGPTAE